MEKSKYRDQISVLVNSPLMVTHTLLKLNRAAEMAQCIRTRTDLGEDLYSVPHGSSQPPRAPVPGLIVLSGFQRHQAYTQYTYIHASKHLLTKKNNTF